MRLIKIAGRICFVIAGIFLLQNHAQSQLVNTGSAITVTSGAIIFTDGSFTNTANATFENDGSIVTNGDIINDAGSSLSGDGMYSMQGNFTNTGTYNQGFSVLEFFGANNSILKNASGNIYTLQVNKNTNKFISINDKEKVLHSVIFLNDKNWIHLNNRVLTLGGNCDVINYSNKRYFITNAKGSLKKLNVKNKPFTFPVGFDKNTYNPLTITEAGTPDDYSVRCMQNALLNGADGDTISNGGINAGWFVSEAIAGGANAIVQAEWKTTDELPGFDYTNCMVVRYAGSSWNFNANQAGTAIGTTYRDISRSGFSSFGYFTVLSKNPTFTNKIFSSKSESAISNEMAASFKVYPTIVQNSLNIDVPHNDKNIRYMNISIIDETGKTVWQKQNADFQSQKLLLPNITPGMYAVLINYNDSKFVQKIIIGR
jgi:hypothetical protein